MKKPPVLILAALALSGGTVFADYDWQKPHAKVLSTGDLAWAPDAWKSPKLAHASLAESHTDIRELYTWEFAGPFLE